MLQRDGELGAGRRARDTDVPSHGDCELANDRQPETGADRAIAVVAAVEEEAIEGARKLVRRDSRTGVLDRELAG